MTSVQAKAKSKGGRPAKSAEGALTKTMAFRLRPALEQKLRESALREGRSMSEEVEARLNRSVQNEAALAEMFGSADQRALLIALGNAIRLADALSDAPERDAKVQGYAAAIAIAQGLAGERAADILSRASETSHGWREAAAGVLALERQIDADEAVLLVDPPAAQLPPRTRAVLKEELAEIAQEQHAVSTKEQEKVTASSKPSRRRPLGEIMGR